ncbi:protein indeterminate-domain 11-like [Syzygium oleosum]|uniref:protein indeterminate-domain 11-like n=1 Tax=Syzygium oleosum TaxID=219896 RepID=UPI0024BA6B19|nr:protein indeterminate-domain 11-like [Syzygium oleosum]
MQQSPDMIYLNVTELKKLLVVFFLCQAIKQLSSPPPEKKMSNIIGEDGSFSSGNAGEAEVQPPELLNHFFGANNPVVSSASANNDRLSASTQVERQQQQAPQELNADPSAEVIALSPETLMATKPFTCEICKMGFKKDQNLQLHRRGHNLSWKLEPAYVHNPKL